MDIQMLTRFFMWCTLMNMVLLVVTFSMVAFAGDFIYKVHSTWFPMPRETFHVVFYAYVGLYKIVVLVFNIVPWAALAIIG